MKIIQQMRREGMGEAQAEVLSARVADAGTAIGAAPQWAQRAGPLAAYIAKTVGREHLVLIAEAVVEPDVERILIVDVVLVGEIIVGKPGKVGLGIEIRNILAQQY